MFNLSLTSMSLESAVLVLSPLLKLGGICGAAAGNFLSRFENKHSVQCLLIQQPVLFWIVIKLLLTGKIRIFTGIFFFINKLKTK